MMKRLLFLVVLIFVIVESIAGLRSAPGDLRNAEGPWQRLVSLSAIVSGVAGLISVAACLARRRWALLFAIVWAAGCVLASSLAPVVYGGAPAIASVLSGAAALLVVCLVVHVLRKFSSQS